VSDGSSAIVSLVIVGALVAPGGFLTLSLATLRADAPAIHVPIRLYPEWWARLSALPNLFRTIVECDRQQLKARRFEEFSPTSLVEFRHKSTNVSADMSSLSQGYDSRTPALDNPSSNKWKYTRPAYGCHGATTLRTPA